MLSTFIIHGNDGTVPLFLAADIDEKAESLDTGTLKYSCADRHHFVKGAMVDDPEYAGLHIINIASKKDGPVWDIILAVEGIAGPKAERHLKGSPAPTYSAVDWDRVSIKMITNSPNRFVQGQIIGGYGMAMACMEATPVPLDNYTGWYTISASLMGIAQNKPGTRSIECSGRTISGDNITWPLQPGWTTPRPGEVQVTGITVTDVTFSTSPPDTGSVPCSRPPPDTPAIRQIILAITGAREYWPNGWVYRPSAEQLIRGQSIWKHSEVYSYQQLALPVG